MARRNWPDRGGHPRYGSPLRALPGSRNLDGPIGIKALLIPDPYSLSVESRMNLRHIRARGRLVAAALLAVDRARAAAPAPAPATPTRASPSSRPSSRSPARRRSSPRSARRRTSCSAAARTRSTRASGAAGDPGGGQQVGLVVRALPLRVPLVPVAGREARRPDRLPRRQRQRLRGRRRSSSSPSCRCPTRPTPTRTWTSPRTSAARRRRSRRPPSTTAAASSSSSHPGVYRGRAGLDADVSRYVGLIGG